MAETFNLGGKRVTLIDLSDRVSNSTSAFQPNAHRIEYLDHQQTAAASGLTRGLPEGTWPDGLGYAVETVTLTTHSGTHVDAPYHYGPTSGGKPARTIDQVPLRWCYGDGVVLDMTHKKSRESITAEDVQAALARIGYEIKPFDIVLIRTDTSKHYHEPGYELMHAGMRRCATKWLVERGVRLMGIDAWGFDRPLDVMIQEAQAGDKAQYWESHLFGREQEYSHIEKLANLDQIPRPFGFKVMAMPVKLEGASAGWSRVVAIIEEDQGGSQ